MVLASLCLTSSAAAATLGNRTLAKPGQVVTWHGKSPDPTGQGYGPPTEQSCTPSTCDSFVLHVKLPARTFPKGPKNPSPPGIARMNPEGTTDMPGDGILIAIKWATDFDQWNLYVDDMKTGQTVAQAIDVDSNAQSVLLGRPHNGDYKVTMVPFYTDFDKADLSYRGERRLLPQIRTQAPDNFHVADIPPVPSNPTGWRFTGPGTFPTNSCYLDETAQFGSTRCLRFDNDVRNIGAGPLVLRFAYTPDAFTGHCKMTQEMLSSLQSDTQDALENLRDLARGIYPPLLADKGLSAALEGQANKAAIPITGSASGIGRYPQEVEAAVYFCCLEALQNAGKYAGEAAEVAIEVGRTDEALRFSVHDTGPGFDLSTFVRTACTRSSRGRTRTAAS